MNRVKIISRPALSLLFFTDVTAGLSCGKNKGTHNFEEPETSKIMYLPLRDSDFPQEKKGNISTGFFKG